MAIVYDMDDFVEELDSGFYKKTILVEGDSWTAYPFPDASNLTQCLDEMTKDDWLILNLAQSGDTAKSIFRKHGSQMKTLTQLLSTTQWGDEFDLIFLSAAGNDLIGQKIVSRGFVENKKDSPFLYGKELLTDNFYEQISKVVDGYNRFLKMRDKSTTNNTTPVITHCYSYLTPRKKGVKIFGHTLGRPGWIRRHLEHQNVRNEDEQYEILCEMFDAFYSRMKRIEGNFDNFIISDTRKALLKDGVPNLELFHDEIHPKKVGYKKVINKIKKDSLARGLWP